MFRFHIPEVVATVTKGLGQILGDHALGDAKTVGDLGMRQALAAVQEKRVPSFWWESRKGDNQLPELIAIDGDRLRSGGGICDCREHCFIAYGAGGVAPFTAQQIDRNIAGHAKNECLPVANRQAFFVIGHGIQTYPGLLESLFRNVRRVGVVAEPIAKAPPMGEIDPDQIFACTENIRRHDNAITLANAAWFMAAAPGSHLEYKTFLKLSSYSSALFHLG